MGKERPACRRLGAGVARRDLGSSSSVGYEPDSNVWSSIQEACTSNLTEENPGLRFWAGFSAKLSSIRATVASQSACPLPKMPLWSDVHCMHFVLIKNNIRYSGYLDSKKDNQFQFEVVQMIPLLLFSWRYDIINKIREGTTVMGAHPSSSTERWDRSLSAAWCGDEQNYRHKKYGKRTLCSSIPIRTWRVYDTLCSKLQKYEKNTLEVAEPQRKLAIIRSWRTHARREFTWTVHCRYRDHPTTGKCRRTAEHRTNLK